MIYPEKLRQGKSIHFLKKHPNASRHLFIEKGNK